MTGSRSARARPHWRRRLVYRFHAALSKGAWTVTLWLALATLAIVVIAGAIIAVFGLGIDEGDSASFFESVWQSLMRTFDAGNMAGDVGWGLRLVTLFVTLGGIFVATALIGVIAAGLDQKIADLRKGRSVVIEEGHTLVLGWSTRLYSVLTELILANENHPGQAIVILAGEDKTVMEDAIRARVPNTGKTRIVCRTGDPSNPGDLELVNAAGARAVIVMAGEADGDAGAVKAVLAVLTSAADLDGKPVVVEMNDSRIAQSLVSATEGRALTVEADEVIAKVTAQACYQAGLSVVYRELLDFGGDEIYLAPADPLVGHSFGEAVLAYPTSTVIGRQTASGVIELVPPMDTTFAAGDKVVAISADDDTVVFAGFQDVPPSAGSADGDRGVVAVSMLVVGWSSIGPRILRELDPFVDEGSSVDVLVDRSVVPAPAEPDCSQLTVRFHTTEDDTEGLTRLLSSSTYDLIVVLGYRDALDPAHADARSLLALLTLRRLLGPNRAKTRVVCEVLDSRDVTLAQASGVDDFVVSDELSSLMIAQLAERPELRAVFDELFDSDGAAISVRPAAGYTNGASTSFADVVAAARDRGQVALGYRLASGDVVLNPPKSAPVKLGSDDRVIVLARSAT